MKPHTVAKKLAQHKMVTATGVKLNYARRVMIYEIVISAMQNMINQIASIPEPIHPSYKQFVRRLIKFMHNERRIMLLANKIVQNERFINLLGQEGFDNESGNEINAIVQNNLLETFSEDATNAVNSHAQNNVIETMDSYSKDPIMTLVMYVVLGFAAYTIYKQYNKSG
jgi:hypothetical protein